jgi:hypothetical protein
MGYPALSWIIYDVGAQQDSAVSIVSEWQSGPGRQERKFTRGMFHRISGSIIRRSVFSVVQGPLGLLPSLAR